MIDLNKLREDATDVLSEPVRANPVMAWGPCDDCGLYFSNEREQRLARAAKVLAELVPALERFAAWEGTAVVGSLVSPPDEALRRLWDKVKESLS